MKSKLKSKYVNSVNQDYYSTIKIEGSSESSESKELTLEEFRNKEQGIVWMDNKGKLIFKDDKI